MPRIGDSRGNIGTTTPVVDTSTPATTTTTTLHPIPGSTDSFTRTESSPGLTGTMTPAADTTTTTATGPSMSVLRLETAHLTSTGAMESAAHLDNDAVTEISPALKAALEANPEIKTNQDMINHAFKEGGDFAGASAYLNGLGLDIAKLTASRNCPLVKPGVNAAQQSVLCAVLRSNPEIETNQDMINFAFKQGGDYAGASRYLEGLGLDMGEMLADRGGMLKPLQVPVDMPAVDEPEPTDNELFSALLRRYPDLETNQDLINHAFEQGGDFAGAGAYLKRFGVEISDLLADRSAALPEPGPSPLQELLEAHPDIKTNQDFINLAFAEGGDFAGASAYAAGFGVSLDQLIANRDDVFDPNNAIDTIGPMEPLPNAPTVVTADQLRQIVPTMSRARAEALAPHINRAMADANINTPLRKAAFLAQIAHESDGFRTNEEYASGAAYEGRPDLGNTQPGDGRRFKGRGFIQLTGRSNYTRAGRDLGIDLVGNPNYAKTNEGAALVTSWFWNANDLNRYADRGDFVGLTRRINGGTNGLADRQRYYARARRIFGA